MKSYLIYLLLIVCILASLIILGVNKFKSETDQNNVLIYDDVSLNEFSRLYLEKELGYNVKLSKSARDIKSISNYGVAKNYPIEKALLIASDTWKVKFYLIGKEVYICKPGESLPCYISEKESTLIYATPIPQAKDLKFSKTVYMCGPNCLAAISLALGKPVSVEKIATLAGTNLQGTTMYGLCEAAKAIGLKSRGVKISIDTYKRKLKCPIIAHLKNPNDHYIIINCYNRDGSFSIIDPPIYKIVPENWLKKHYSGNALLISP